MPPSPRSFNGSGPTPQTKSSVAEIRLSKLIKQFSIGLDTLVEFLNSKGAGFDVPNVNVKVSDEYLTALEERFGRDRQIKEAADKTDVRIDDIVEHVKSGTHLVFEDIPSEDEILNPTIKETVPLQQLCQRYDVSLGALERKLEAMGALKTYATPKTRVPLSVVKSLDRIWKIEFHSSPLESRLAKLSERRQETKAQPNIEPESFFSQKALDLFSKKDEE